MARSKYIQGVLAAAKGRPKSTQWFRDKIKEFGKPTSAQLIRDGKRSSRPFYGLLNIEQYSDGFLGINLHYLSMPMRMRLLDRLVDYSNNDKFDDTTQLLVDYARLKNVSLIKPCLKRYLASNVKTQFRKVTADEFVVATLLPVQKFKKQSDQHVFNKSRGMV